jgi:HNH endonuclease
MKPARKRGWGYAQAFALIAAKSSEDDCILWPFATCKAGYGRMKYYGTMKTAHRVVCEMAHGLPDKEKMHAAHSCVNKKCVNPRHLRWATPKENTADIIAAGNFPVGENKPNSKLTIKDVIAIREMRKFKPIGHVASVFGVEKSHVCAIVSRRIWGHI